MEQPPSPKRAKIDRQDQPVRTRKECSDASIVVDTPTPNFPNEDDFVERATQGITEDTNLSAEVSPTSRATKQPPMPYNVVLGQLHVSRVSLSESSPVLSPWPPTPASTREIKTTCTDPLQSTSALVSQPLLVPVSTTPMTISRPSLSLQHPGTLSLSMEGVPYIPNLASTEGRSSIDPLITADSQTHFFDTNRVAFPTPVTYSGAHPSVSLPSMLTTVAQTTSSPSVTQRLYGDPSSLHVALPTSTVALANQGGIHGNTHDHFRVLSEHGSRGIVVSGTGPLTPAAVEMNRLTGHTAPLATRIPLQSSASLAPGHLTTHLSTSGSAPIIQSLPSLQPTATAMSLSSSSSSRPHQPTVVSTQSVTQSSTDHHDTTIDAHKAGEAFRQHRDNLLIAITDPLFLANALYSKNIISRETLDNILPPTPVNVMKVVLLNAIEARIRTHPSDFLILLAILGRDSQLCIFAEGIRNSYCLQSADAVSPHVSATMRLNAYLINYYNCSQTSLGTKFPHLPNKMFINLAVIEKESVNRADADSFTKGTLHGHADEILKEKKPIEFDEVLEPPEDCQRPKCVFVEGAPGVGKSTFALELCRRKDEIESLKRFSLAILLRLREKEVQEIKNVSDLFYFSDPSLQQSVTKEVVSCGGENVLFVLDGFDEFPKEFRQQSFLVELIQGKHLPACTVLVTSRPSATADLLFARGRRIDKHMEILGFTHDRIKQYAKSMLSDQPDVYEDFLKYIAKNPAIHGMMYIPLNSAIVVEIYKANRATSKPIPCTLTQLYTQLCLVLLKKYLSEKGDPLLAEKLPDNFKKLPESLKEQLFGLGKLAFEGALKQEITFDKLPDGCEGLGFMNVSTSLYLGQKSVLSHSFLHLTLQEFLGALYVSQLPCDSHKLLVIENFVLLSRDEHDFFSRNSHLDIMLRFIAGLTELKSVGWELAHRGMKSGVTDIARLAREEFLSTLFYRALFVQCLLEIQCEETIKNSCDVILKSSSKKGFTVTARTPFDCYAVGYCVAASGHKWSLDSSNIGGNEVVEMLGCGLQSIKQCSGSIYRLLLSRNALTHEAMISISKFPSDVLSGVHILDLSNNRLTKTALDILADSITLMHNLTSLDLSDNPAGEGGMVKVFHELLCTRIHTLTVLNMALGVSDIKAFSPLIIQPEASLKELCITVENIPCELVIETLLSPSSLTELTLRKLNCTAEGASKFQVLENNNNLTTLKFSMLSGCNLAALHIAKALHKNMCLKIIDMEEDLNKHALGLHHQYLYFIGRLSCLEDARADYIEADGILALSEMMEVNQTLETLQNLFINCDVNITTLHNALKRNNTLRTLSVQCRESTGLTSNNKTYAYKCTEIQVPSFSLVGLKE